MDFEGLYRPTVYKTGDAGMCVCHHKSIHLSTITYLENSRLPWVGIVMRESFLLTWLTIPKVSTGQ